MTYDDEGNVVVIQKIDTSRLQDQSQRKIITQRVLDGKVKSIRLPRGKQNNFMQDINTKQMFMDYYKGVLAFDPSKIPKEAQLSSLNP